MDDRRALMAAIIANPDEDTPRLLLADWLQEHGDKHEQARAEFIRLQIESGSSESGRLLEPRERALHSEHAPHWLGPLWELTGSPSSYRARDFDRGLLYWWYSTAGTFLKKSQQAAVCAQFPLLGVRMLMLTDSSKRAQAVADSPAIAWVCNFYWQRSRLDDDSVRALAASPHTVRLSALGIDHPHCSNTGLKALAQSTCLPNLRRFDLTDGLWGGKYNHAGVLQILNSDRLARLCELNLDGNQPSGFEDAPFFRDEGLTRLCVLWYHSRTEMRHLVACTHLTNLEELLIGDSHVTDADVRTLLDNPTFAKLKKLALNSLNSNQPPLSDEVEQRLRDRFATGLTLSYSALCQRAQA